MWRILGLTQVIPFTNRNWNIQFLGKLLSYEFYDDGLINKSGGHLSCKKLHIRKNIITML